MKPKKKLNAQKLEEENKKTLKQTQDEVQRILEDARVQARKQHEEIIHEEIFVQTV